MKASTKGVVVGLAGIFAFWVWRRRNPQAPWHEGLLPAAAGAGLALAGCTVAEHMAETHRLATAPRAFISHHHGPDGWFKDHLVELAESEDAVLQFQNVSVTAPIRSSDPSRIRADLTRRIRYEVDYLLVLVGEHTHKRPYVLHEIEQALLAGVPIRVIKLDRRFKTPDRLKGVGARWAMSPKLGSVMRVLRP